MRERTIANEPYGCFIFYQAVIFHGVLSEERVSIHALVNNLFSLPNIMLSIRSFTNEFPTFTV